MKIEGGRRLIAPLTCLEIIRETRDDNDKIAINKMNDDN